MGSAFDDDDLDKLLEDLPQTTSKAVNPPKSASNNLSSFNKPTNSYGFGHSSDDKLGFPKSNPNDDIFGSFGLPASAPRKNTKIDEKADHFGFDAESKSESAFGFQNNNFLDNSDSDSYQPFTQNNVTSRNERPKTGASVSFAPINSNNRGASNNTPAFLSNNDRPTTQPTPNFMSDFRQSPAAQQSQKPPFLQPSSAKLGLDENSVSRMASNQQLLSSPPSRLGYSSNAPSNPNMNVNSSSNNNMNSLLQPLSRVPSNNRLNNNHSFGDHNDDLVSDHGDSNPKNNLFSHYQDMNATASDNNVSSNNAMNFLLLRELEAQNAEYRMEVARWKEECESLRRQLHDERETVEENARRRLATIRSEHDSERNRLSSTIRKLEDEVSRLKEIHSEELKAASDKRAAMYAEFETEKSLAIEDEKRRGRSLVEEGRLKNKADVDEAKRVAARAFEDERRSLQEQINGLKRQLAAKGDLQAVVDRLATSAARVEDLSTSLHQNFDPSSMPGYSSFGRNGGKDSMLQTEESALRELETALKIQQKETVLAQQRLAEMLEKLSAQQAEHEMMRQAEAARLSSEHQRLLELQSNLKASEALTRDTLNRERQFLEEEKRALDRAKRESGQALEDKSFDLSRRERLLRDEESRLKDLRHQLDIARSQISQKIKETENLVASERLSLSREIEILEERKRILNDEKTDFLQEKAGVEAMRREAQEIEVQAQIMAQKTLAKSEQVRQLWDEIRETHSAIVELHESHAAAQREKESENKRLLLERIAFEKQKNVNIFQPSSPSAAAARSQQQPTSPSAGLLFSSLPLKSPSLPHASSNGFESQIRDLRYSAEAIRNSYALKAQQLSAQPNHFVSSADLNGFSAQASGAGIGFKQGANLVAHPNNDFQQQQTLLQQQQLQQQQQQLIAQSSNGMLHHSQIPYGLMLNNNNNNNPSTDSNSFIPSSPLPHSLISSNSLTFTKNTLSTQSVAGTASDHLKRWLEQSKKATAQTDRILHSSSNHTARTSAHYIPSPTPHHPRSFGVFNVQQPQGFSQSGLQPVASHAVSASSIISKTSGGSHFASGSLFVPKVDVTKNGGMLISSSAGASTMTGGFRHSAGDILNNNHAIATTPSSLQGNEILGGSSIGNELNNENENNNVNNGEGRILGSASGLNQLSLKSLVPLAEH